MSNFDYNQYQEVIARAQNGSNGSSTKIGFFKMKNDKDEALVRFNVSSLEGLQFATVHQLGAAQKWMKVSCLNPVGSYHDTCPLCAAVAGGAKDIGKASKKVYVQMLVAYKDPTTGQFSAAIPVIWERPAGFSREIANLLKDYGDLKTRVFKVTRNGVANSMQTTYSISYIPLFDKPESVPEDFSAFANFNIAKHSFWEKTVGEIQVFLNTGSFPEAAKAPQAPMPTDADAPYQAPAAPRVENFTAPAQPAFVPPVTNPEVAPWEAPAPQTAQPAFVPGITTTPAVIPNPVNPAVDVPGKTVPSASTVENPVQTAASAPDFGRPGRSFGDGNWSF